MNIYHPVVDKDKQDSDQEGIDSKDFERYIFGRFDIHFKPDI
jgi:hypothetical protein